MKRTLQDSYSTLQPAKGATSTRTIRQGLGLQFHFMRANFSLACAVNFWWSKRDSSEFGTWQCFSHVSQIASGFWWWWRAERVQTSHPSSCSLMLLFRFRRGSQKVLVQRFCWPYETQTCTLIRGLGSKRLSSRPICTVAELCLQVSMRLFQRF